MDMTRRTATRIKPDPVVLSAREPADLIGVVPYLLGFHPTESLVAVFLRQRRVEVTARMDLVATESVDGLIAHLELVSQRVGTRTLVLLGYSAEEKIRQTLTDLGPALPFDLVDILAVGPHRWWSVLCDGDCCPSEGTPYDIGSHLLAAEAVLAGMPTASARDEIAALTAGPEPDEMDRLTRMSDACEARLAGASHRRRRQRMRRGVQRGLGASGPSDLEAIELAVLAAEVAIRDVAWAMMTREEADSHVALWRHVVALTPAPYEPAPLGLLAMAGWLSGNGALLNCCIDRLEEIAPDYSLLSLCRDISESAVPPSCFDELSGDLRALAG